MTDKANLYQLDGRVPVLTAIPFGLQHYAYYYSGQRGWHRLDNQRRADTELHGDCGHRYSDSTLSRMAYRIAAAYRDGY